ncbi:hypothetical protein CRUP_024185 [Coryphaenoides rupestris]|nr:hypothetical protein CRUP_024185 [Coryphaenoides rupestris]
MMQHGVDLRLLDLQGKTCLHHAVTGGSIVAVHYLWETGMFRYSDTDMYQVSSLHLAASTSNTEVVRYLLRNQRCAVNAVDQQGGTALHVAAEHGSVEVCWTLLQRAGYWMLHQKNHQGLTPLDLSKQGKTFRHQQLTKLLCRYINEPIHQMPKESHALYYWTLLYPSLSGAVIFLVSAAVGGYGGLLCGLLFPWLASSIFTQFHRLTTYQSMVHFALLLGLLCKILTQDPGTLDRADSDPRFSCIADLLFQPDHSKHCKLCDVCVEDYDHHCLFLNRCVGRGNHRLFLVFLLAMAAAHLLFIATAASYLSGKMAAVGRYNTWGGVTEAAVTWSTWLPFLAAEFWVAVLACMNALTLVWEAWVLREQFDAIAGGTTTYFQQSEAEAGRPRSLGQRWAAIFSFLLEGRRGVARRQGRADKMAIDI